MVLDQATGELVERGTYQAYGGAESDYRPERWKSFREDYRFTGKEEDVEVGLQYFGKRYYAPLLNRWVSADPLALHEFDADLNLYAYVSGQALKAIDPLGLEGKHGESAPGNVPVAKDESVEVNEVGHGGGTQSAPRFSEEELVAAGIVAVCAATAGGACVGLATSADSSGRDDLKGDPELAVTALLSPAGGAPKVIGKAGAPAKRVVAKAASGGKPTPAQMAAELEVVEASSVKTLQQSANSGAITRVAPGKVTSVTKPSVSEKAFAEEFFASRGYNVELAGRGKAGADIRVLETGQRYELKQLTTKNPSAVATRIGEALQQAPNAIMDLRKSGLTNVQAIMGYKEAVRKGFVQSGQTVRLITKNGLDATF